MTTTERTRGFLIGALSDELGDLAERVRAGVVEVSDGRGSGAGTIWSSDGLIVTNFHVVPGKSARVTVADDRELEGRVIGSLPERDLALLKVDAVDLPALAVGDSTRLRPGEIVFAVGHPHGIPGVVTFGVFSRYGPYEGSPGRHFREGLLADLELRPGNSGGPLVNARGEVVGINAMVLGPGTALAIPSATVSRLLASRKRRTIGIQVTMVRSAPAIGADVSADPKLVLMVLDVVPDSSAARAGLLPGDILLALNGEPLEEPGDIAWALAGASTSSTLRLTLMRAGLRTETTLTIAA